MKKQVPIYVFIGLCIVFMLSSCNSSNQIKKIDPFDNDESGFRFGAWGDDSETVFKNETELEDIDIEYDEYTVSIVGYSEILGYKAKVSYMFLSNSLFCGSYTFDLKDISDEIETCYNRMKDKISEKHGKLTKEETGENAISIWESNKLSIVVHINSDESLVGIIYFGKSDSLDEKLTSDKSD